MTDLIKSTIWDARKTFAIALNSTPEIAEKYALGIYNTVILNDKLMGCDPLSIRDAAITSAVLGVPIDARQYAYLIPYGTKAQFQMSYKGYVYIAKRDPDVDSIQSNLVYEDDTFSIDIGMNTLSHIPNLESPKYGKDEYIKYVYAMVRFRSNTGRSMSFEVMTKAQVDDIRAVSKAGGEKDKWNKPTIWAQYYGEMARKTAIKRLCKHAQLGDVARIDEVDNSLEQDRIINVTPTGELKIDDSLKKNEKMIIELIDKSNTKEELDKIYNEHGELIEELAGNYLSNEITKLTKEKKDSFYADMVIELLEDCIDSDGLDKVYNNHLVRLNQLKAAIRNQVSEKYCLLKQTFTEMQYV